MSRLSGLPDEALSQILDLLFFDTINLWCSGDRILITRIVRCCHSIRSPPKLALVTLKRWPRFIPELKSLRSLDITVVQVSEGAHAVANELRKLPKGLLELCISFQHAHFVPFAGASILTVNPYLKPPVSSSKTTSAHLLGDTHSTASWWTSDFFPVLKKARFWSPMANDLQVTFGGFPDSLDSLSWSIKLDGGNKHVFSRLPAGLTSLEISSATSDHLAAASLPRGLTHLNGPSWGQGADLAALPRTLATGSWFSTTSDFTPSLLQSLPPAISKISAYSRVVEPSFQSLGIEWTAALPRFLTSLFLLPTSPLTASLVFALPRTLMSLKNVSLNMDSIYQSTKEGQYQLDLLWPPQLRTLRLEFSTLISTSHVYLLPRTLAKLERLALRADDPISDRLSTLPPLLTHLSLRNGGDFDIWKPNHPLPPLLTVLDLNSTANLKFDLESFQYLSPGLKKLIMPQTNVRTTEEAESLAQLPRGLLELSIGVLHSDGFALLPRTLNMLSTFYISGDLTEEQGQLIPPSLKRMFISAHVASRMTPARPSWTKNILLLDIDDL